VASRYAGSWGARTELATELLVAPGAEDGAWGVAVAMECAPAPRPKVAGRQPITEGRNRPVVCGKHNAVRRGPSCFHERR
jgi:hypothetical protein